MLACFGLRLAIWLPLPDCRLYRDSTLWKNGKHLRDLGKLNRDLNNVLLVTADTGAAELNPDNCIKV